MSYVGNPLATAFAPRVKQDLTGQSGTSFTLSHAVSSANDLSVYINHVRQEPTTAYTVDYTTLSTTGTVASTDDFYIIFDELALQSIAHDEFTAMKATSGTFTGAITTTQMASSGPVSGTTGTFSGAISGTLGTAAQPNVTSVGTLTNLRTSDIVGIGQASPTSPNGATAFLHIGNGDEQDVGIVLQDAVETWEIYQNDNLHFRYDTTDVMTMARLTGNVGIGATNPGTKLQVVNDTDTDYNISTATTNAVLNLKNNTAGANNCVGMSFSTESNGEWYLTCVQESSSETAFHIGARAYGSRHDRMKINSDGTVLIGNKDSNPTAWGLRVFNVHGTHATIEGWNDNSGGKNLNLFRYDDASIFQVSNGGAVWAAGGYSSDKAFKNIIGDCTEGWSKLKDVQPKSYRHKRISNVEQEDGTTKEVFSDDDMDSNIHYGVIAQDLKKVLPDITYGEEGKMSVDYHGLLMVAINTIKELESRITALENK